MDLVGSTDKNYAKVVRKRMSRAGSKPRRTGEHTDPMERLQKRISQTTAIGKPHAK